MNLGTESTRGTDLETAGARETFLATEDADVTIAEIESGVELYRNRLKARCQGKSHVLHSELRKQVGSFDIIASLSDRLIVLGRSLRHTHKTRNQKQANPFSCREVFSQSTGVGERKREGCACSIENLAHNVPPRRERMRFLLSSSCFAASTHSIQHPLIEQ